MFIKPRSSWVAKSLLSHTFFLKFPGFKHASQENYLTYRLHIFTRSQFCEVLSIFRTSDFVAQVKTRAHMLMTQKNVNKDSPINWTRCCTHSYNPPCLQDVWPAKQTRLRNWLIHPCLIYKRKFPTNFHIIQGRNTPSLCSRFFTLSRALHGGGGGGGGAHRNLDLWRSVLMLSSDQLH